MSVVVADESGKAQLITKGAIEEIRGVNADHAVNRLMQYGLITERGRLNAPGKPILLGTSEQFLRFYGLTHLQDLYAAHENDTITTPSRSESEPPVL
jgi:segregation and condensation protein B